AKLKQTALSAGVRLDLQSGGIQPGDVDTARYSHHTGCPVRPAEISTRAIFLGIPRIGDFATFVIEWDARIIALRRRHHAPAPVFGYNRNPVSCEIDRSGFLRRPLGSLLSAASLQKQKCDQK